MLNTPPDRSGGVSLFGSFSPAMRSIFCGFRSSSGLGVI
jgi:hypothetical protein